MEDYKSKFKNPDKYIAQLKKQNDEAWRACRHANNQMGERLIYRGTGQKQEGYSTNGLQYNKFDVGDTVINVGVVRQVCCNKQDGANRSEVFFDVIETRVRKKV